MSDSLSPIRSASILLTALVLFAPPDARGANPGDRDSTFGNCGTIGLDLVPGNEYGRSVAVVPGGDILVGGKVGNSATTAFVVRLHADGTLDAGFGDAGRVSIAELDTAFLLRAQLDDSIIAVGRTGAARLLPDGSLDANFGNNGIVPFGSGGLPAADAAAQSDDGTLLIANGWYSSVIAVSRLLANGELDMAFGSGGQVQIDLGIPVSVRQVLAYSDGRTLIGATWHQGGSPVQPQTTKLVRLGADGSLDLTFGDVGVVTLLSDPTGFSALAIALQPDGSVIVAQPHAVERLHDDGSEDSTFQGSPGFGNVYHDILLQSDGKVVATGTYSLQSSQYRTARFRTDGTIDDVRLCGTDSPFPDVTETFGSYGTLTLGGVQAALQADGRILFVGSWSNFAAGIESLATVTRIHSLYTPGESCDDPGETFIEGSIQDPQNATGTAVYANTNKKHFEDIIPGYFGGNLREFGDDLHLLRAGTLESFDVMFRNEDVGPTPQTLVVRFYANDPMDGGMSPGDLEPLSPSTRLATIIACLDQSDPGELVTVSVAPSVPVDLPADVWMTMQFEAGTSSHLVASSYVEIGSSHPWAYGLFDGTYIQDLGSLNLPFVVRFAPDPAIDTPAGQNVAVMPSPGASVTFGHVQTAGATTSTTSGANPLPDSNFEFLGQFYDIATNAEFNGAATVCLSYDDTGLSLDQENALVLLHLENGSWINITSSNDPESNVVCGATTSFSPFAIAHQLPHPAQGLIESLVDAVSLLNLKKGVANSLDAKLAHAQGALADFNEANDGSAANAILAFINEVEAQSGNQVPAEDAAELLDMAVQVLVALAEEGG